MDWSQFANYGLPGIVIAALLLGFAATGLFLFWALRYTLKEIVRPAAERLVAAAVDVMRAHVEFLHASVASLRKIEATVIAFQAESQDPDMPYSAVRCRQQLAMLAELQMTTDENRKAELMREIRGMVKS